MSGTIQLNSIHRGPGDTTAVECGGNLVVNGSIVSQAAVGTVAGGMGNQIATLAALGSTQADGAPVVSTYVRVTAADGTKGVVLPSLASVPTGAMIIVINSDTTSALKAYTNEGNASNISGQAGATAISIAAKVSVFFIKYDATNWYGIKGVTPY